MNQLKGKGVILKFNTVKLNIKRYIPKPKYKLFICDYCKIRFSRRVSLIIHIRRHHVNICNICTKEFSSRWSVTRHLKNVHGCTSNNLYGQEKMIEYPATSRFGCLSKKRKIFCHHCKKTFISNYSLKRHSLKPCIKKSSILIRCMCGKKFQNQPSFESHLYSGKTQYMYDCDNCDKKYVRKNSFLQHIIGHNEDRTYKCNVCSKSYLRKSCLKIHEETHSKEIHKCKICKGMFKKKYILLRHIKNFH